MKEENKIIAKFMGGEYLHDFNPTYITFRQIEFGGMSGNYSCDESELYFHSSWDWIMPVIRKIESLKYATHIHCYDEESYCVIKEGNYRRGYGENTDKKKAILIAVIEFINYYTEIK